MKFPDVGVEEDDGSRYEFRVWGERDKACKRLAKLADVEQRERLEDCYLLVPDDACNIKIRQNRLKVKRLVDERHGFQRWSSIWHRAANGAPEPFDRVMEELATKRARRDDGRRALVRAVDRLDPDDGVRAVFVSKRRRRFRFGAMRAEASEVKVSGTPGKLFTVAIEGPDLGDLVDLRKLLGLAKTTNLALHLAVDPAHGLGS